MACDVILTREEKRVLDDYDSRAFNSTDSVELRKSLVDAARNTPRKEKRYPRRGTSR